MNARRMMTMLAGCLAATGPLAAQERPDSGGFVVRQGADTVAVETFWRTGDRLTGELTVPSSGARVAYTATLSPDGRIPRMEVRAEPGPAATVVFRGDSATLEVVGAPPQRFAPGAGALPYLNLSSPVLEQILRRARVLGSGPATIPLLNLRGGGTIAATVEPLGADSARILLGPGVEIRAATDAEGCLLGATIPSQNVVIERVRSIGGRHAAVLLPDYSAPSGAPYTAEDVVIPVKGFILAGTLTLPRNAKGPVPAVVLISGSGPQDRDSAMPPIPGYRPFRQIADTLGRRGIAVLRVDDRGVGGSGGAAPGVTSADFADDVRASLAFLRERKEIDPKRLGLVGHSEGGIIAPMVAATDPRLRAIALMAAPSRTGRRVVLHQNREVLRQSGLDPRQVDSAVATLPARLDSAAASSPWLRSFLDYDPLPTAAKVRAPVLIVQGETDLQVTPDQMVELAAAIRSGGNREVTTRVFPRLNHLFLLDPIPSLDVSRYAALPSKQVPPEVLGTLADWLAVRLR